MHDFMEKQEKYEYFLAEEIFDLDALLILSYEYMCTYLRPVQHPPLPLSGLIQQTINW